jgi:hypothetical protein
VADLDDRPTFHALSYVWGIKSLIPKDIEYDRHILEVTNNCHDALLHLRKRYGRLIVWIDAVCINQGDDREKERQILLMCQIYANSTQVLIWLGPGTAASDRAMAYMSNATLFETTFKGQSTTHTRLFDHLEDLSLEVESEKV